MLLCSFLAFVIVITGGRRGGRSHFEGNPIEQAWIERSVGKFQRTVRSDGGNLDELWFALWSVALVRADASDYIR